MSRRIHTGATNMYFWEALLKVILIVYIRAITYGLSNFEIIKSQCAKCLCYHWSQKIWTSLQYENTLGSDIWSPSTEAYCRKLSSLPQGYALFVVWSKISVFLSSSTRDAETNTHHASMKHVFSHTWVWDTFYESHIIWPICITTILQIDYREM